MLQALLAPISLALSRKSPWKPIPKRSTLKKAAQWAAAKGFNRISCGTQSFIDEELKAAGRMHRREDIYRAVPTLRALRAFAISASISLPACPSRRKTPRQQSLCKKPSLSAPEHISIYMMEIDESSRLSLEVLQSGSRYGHKDIPSEEAMAEFYELAQAELKTAGYHQYEISNWAKPGFRIQTQSQILAARAVSRIRCGSALVFRHPALGQSS